MISGMKPGAPKPVPSHLNETPENTGDPFLVMCVGVMFLKNGVGPGVPLGGCEALTISAESLLVPPVVVIRTL
jgi:hypothetical protein